MRVKLEHLSASTLESYEACPRRLWKRKVDDPKDTSTVFTEAGRAVHKTLEVYHTDGLGPHKNLSALFDSVVVDFAPLDFHRFNDMRTLLLQYERENPVPSPTIGVELDFEFPLGDFNVVGYIDRIDYLGDGVYEIIDYKTSYMKKEAEELKHDIQGVVYDIALRKLWEQDSFPGLPEPERVIFSLYFIRYGKVSAEYDASERENALAFIEYTGHRIEMDDEEPEPRLNSFCRSCDYRGDCPLFTGEWQKYLDAELYTDLDDLVGLLDKYKNIRKILETKIKDLNEQILVQLQDDGITQYVNLSGVSASIQSQARSSYDIDSLKSSLPDWTKYGTIDVKALLESGSSNEVAIANKFKHTNRTRPYINTKQTRF